MSIVEEDRLLPNLQVTYDMLEIMYGEKQKELSVIFKDKVRIMKDYFKDQTLVDKSFHAIMIRSDGGEVATQCVGIDCVDSPLKNTYDNLDELPEWVQLKVAVLMGCQDGHTIDDIGRRVDDHTFWVFGGEE